MARRKAIVGAFGSVGLHVAVLVSLVGSPPVELPPSEPEDELVAVIVAGTAAPSSAPRERAPGPEDVPPPRERETPEPAREPDPPPSTPRHRSARPEPAPSTAAPQLDAPEPTSEVSASPEPSGDEGGGDAPETDTGRPNSHGAGSSRPSGGDRVDGSAYGSEIVRLVLAEIDGNPVPGITRRDGIQVLLRVKPDGSLAFTGSGRFGFAQVLRSSLGPLRTRAILKRIERASRRFPAHPAGLKRSHFVVDVTVEFTRAT